MNEQDIYRVVSQALTKHTQMQGIRKTNILLAWIFFFLVAWCTIVSPILSQGISTTTGIVQDSEKIINQFLNGKELNQVGQVLPIGKGCKVTDIIRWRASHPVSGLPSMHNGVDIYCVEAHPDLYAPFDGELSIIQPEDAQGGGLTFRLTSLKEDLVLQIMHSTKQHRAPGPVRVKQWIGQGQAQMGTPEAGSVTGPHIHIEWFSESEEGRRYHNIHERLIYALLQP